MLVLSRQEDETIVITTPMGERITIVLVNIRGNKARLGVQASMDYEVHRGEVQAEIDRQQEVELARVKALAERLACQPTQ